MNLKERIKELCDKNGISMNKLEKECGFARGYISKLGKTTPNSSNLQRIADYFQISLDCLMNGEEYADKFAEENALMISKMRNDIELSKALSKYFELSDVEKKHIIELINILYSKN